MVQLPNLPTDISRDILSRLPVKSLLRFRCVSKPWCKLIDSQDFINLHLKQSLTTHSNRSIILGGLDIYTVDLDALDCANELKPPFKYFEISNSINGLFLVMSDDSPLIWNPCTRKHKVLPGSNLEYPRGALPGSGYETYGFGYDAKNDDYKVVKSVKCKGSDFEWMNCEATVFSLRSNTWRKIEVFPYPLPHKRVWGVYVNGALHCHFVSPELIMAFHVGNEKHFVVPSPDLSGNKSDMSSLAQIGGCLCLVNPSKKDRFDVWMMKDYGVQESWMKLFSVAPPMIDRCVLVSPLAYSKSGNEVLLNNDHERLAWYDLERRTVRNVQVRNLPFVFYAETYVGSLVRVDGYRVFDTKDSEDVVKKPSKQEKPMAKKIRKNRDDFLSEGFKLVL